MFPFSAALSNLFQCYTYLAHYSAKKFKYFVWFLIFPAKFFVIIVVVDVGVLWWLAELLSNLFRLNVDRCLENIFTSLAGVPSLSPQFGVVFCWSCYICVYCILYQGECITFNLITSSRLLSSFAHIHAASLRAKRNILHVNKLDRAISFIIL